MKAINFIRKGEGENYNYAQDHCFIKLSSRDTNGELCIIEDTLKPGFHLNRHHHKIMTEVFYILEGELELIFDNETTILKEGDTITVPPNVWHEANYNYPCFLELRKKLLPIDNVRDYNFFESEEYLVAKSINLGLITNDINQINKMVNSYSVLLLYLRIRIDEELPVLVHDASEIITLLKETYLN